MCVYMYICIYIFICVRIYMYVVCIYTYIYIYIIRPEQEKSNISKSRKMRSDVFPKFWPLAATVPQFQPKDQIHHQKVHIFHPQYEKIVATLNGSVR